DVFAGSHHGNRWWLFAAQSGEGHNGILAVLQLQRLWHFAHPVSAGDRTPVLRWQIDPRLDSDGWWISGDPGWNSGQSANLLSDNQPVQYAHHAGFAGRRNRPPVSFTQSRPHLSERRL